MSRAGKMSKKRPMKRRRIKLSFAEKVYYVLCDVLCLALVGIFVFMTWYMYNPKSRLAHNLKYSRRYLEAADYVKAEAGFKRILSIDAGNVEAYKGLMEVALSNKDTDEAVLLYGRGGEVLQSYKEPLQELLEARAVERVSEGDYDGAFSVAVTVENVTGDRNEAALIRALVIDGMISDAKKLKGEEAIALYRRILAEENVDKAAIYILMIDVYESAGDHDAALAMLDEGINVTGDERLTSRRSEVVQDNAETFLPDSFVKDMNDAMAEGNFRAAADIITHELFLYRIEEYAFETDQFGERSFDLTPIQPADMNSTIYEEKNADGALLMIIVDWERTTEREAAFNELVWVPSTGELMAMSQKQRVNELNELVDEGHYWKLVGEEQQEIDQQVYFDRLSDVFSEEFSEQLKAQGYTGDTVNADAEEAEPSELETSGAETGTDSTTDTLPVLESDSSEDGVMTDASDAAGDMNVNSGGITTVQEGGIL